MTPRLLLDPIHTMSARPDPARPGQPQSGRPRPGAPAADRDSPADQLFEAVHGLMHRYRGEQYRAMQAGGHELSHLEGKVLGFFLRQPGATLKDLVGHAGRDKGQLARLIGGLKAAGLLEASPDPLDRRNIRLSPSAEGRAIQQRLAAKARRLNEAAVAGLSTAELSQLLALLARVRANIDGVEAGDPADPTVASE